MVLLIPIIRIECLWWNGRLLLPDSLATKLNEGAERILNQLYACACNTNTCTTTMVFLRLSGVR